MIQTQSAMHAIRRMTATLSGGLVAANAVAWVWAWIAFHDRPALLGSAFLAWMFGLRHAVDPDHIGLANLSLLRGIWRKFESALAGCWLVSALIYRGRRAGGGGLKRKRFFFEKKKQKTFSPCGALQGWGGTRPEGG